MHFLGADPEKTAIYPIESINLLGHLSGLDTVKLRLIPAGGSNEDRSRDICQRAQENSVDDKAPDKSRSRDDRVQADLKQRKRWRDSP